jgi:DNA-directed RNA polymerase subunit beta'
VVPVVHIWYFKSLPNKIGYLLGMSSKKLETIIYYERYVVIQPGIKDNFKVGDLLTEEEYLDLLDTLPKDNQYLPDDDAQKFVAKMGADAVHDLLGLLDLDELSFSLRNAAANETSQQRKADALKRLSVVESFREAKTHITNQPEWMVMKYIPVIPPELRPLVPLDGGRFASSDLNDLYRRVIIRNNRLKRLLEIKAPEVILRNEKRMLQEAIDSLFDNSRKSNAVKAEGGRALKSLSDVLKGKQGRFRQNLLGKRVDYSGRSVIVVGPELRMHECGLPKDMAAELFKPFIIRKLIERGIVKTVKSAKKLVDKKEAVIWDILENILKGHPVMLNRAPTLHRLSIQAFQPKLVEGKAIQLHPLVTSAFNADFDGDQMAVHVPLSHAAILEAQLLMLSSHNILNPQNGTPITLPSQDMVLGLYYITKGKKSMGDLVVRGEGKAFYNLDEVIIAYNEDRIDLHANIRVKTNIRENGQLVNKLIETTVGRVLFNQHTPKAVGFVNQLLTKKSLRDIIGDIIKITDVPTTAKFLDDIKTLGFRMAFRGGLSFNVNDLVVPEARHQLLENAKLEVEEVWENYNMGLITNNERYNQVIDIWGRVDTRITDTLIREMATDKQGFNSVYMMLDSGARGSKTQVKQLVGIRGLMAKPRKSGSTGSEVIENPILSNFKGGLNVLDYFISTHGARKGLADTALKTADAGYLTRRLVDVSQDVVISETDCGTLRGIATSALKDNEDIIEPLADRIEGRTSLHDVFNPITNEIIVAAGEEITIDEARAIEDAGIETVEIRSVLTCESKRGVCVKCYGRNLATGYITQNGDAVGIIAAQSIGEPGTQLTLRTFHVGGVAGSSSVESSLNAKFDGTIQFDGLRTVDTINNDGNKVKVVIGRTGEVRIMDVKNDRLMITNNVPYGALLAVKDGAQVKKGDVICTWDPFNNVIVAEQNGKIKFENINEGFTYRDEADEQTGHREKVVIESKDKTRIPTIILEGGKDNKHYNLPVGSHIVIEEGVEVKAGHVLVKIPRVLGKLRDITGGLPRVTELFEARNPGNPAIVCEIDGIVAFGNIKRGNREIIVESKDGMVKKYLVPLTRQILVQDSDFVKAGSPLSDGQIAPADILSIRGPYAVQEYVVNEIQEVYRLQGVKINDKHIEVIVRQMMKKVEIVDAGDTKFLEEDLEDRFDFIEENDRIYDKKVVTDAGESAKLKAGQIVTVRELREENSILRRNDKKVVEVRDAKPATARPVLLGITKASLGVQSWISAASFQETTKVLSQAAIQGKVDMMLGLKENVITGHLIPAGTGQKQFEKLIVGSKEEYEVLATTREAMSFDEEE